MINKFKKIKLENFYLRLFSVYFILNSFLLILNNNFLNIEYMQRNNMLIYALLFIVIFFICSILSKRVYKVNFDSLTLLLGYSVCVYKWLEKIEVYNNYNLLFLLIIMFFFAIIIINFVNLNKKLIKNIKLNKKLYWLLLSLIIIIPCLILVTISCFRYLNYNAPNFDFGIFSNIFYNLKKSFVPISTCERDMVLSHFAVHFSPIFYLILPIYYIFSSPITLQVIQALALFSGVIPVIKIAKHYNLSNNKILIISILYCFYPVLSSGCFYDFHENCFLPLCLLWLFYFFEKNNLKFIFIFSLLTLLIKEDAFIYVFIFALYIIVSRKKYKLGLALISMSLIYFILANHVISSYGLGVMVYRYENLMNGGNSLLSVIKTILINPGYTLMQLLNNTDASFDKLFYLLKVMLPLCFLPLITKKFSRYILVIPILINLLTNYIYQYDITFHYSFGILAFLFYVSILNLSDLKFESSSYILLISMVITLSLYYLLIVPSFKQNIFSYIDNKETYAVIEESLKMIPDDVSVSASTFFVPHLANRDEIYEDYYHDKSVITDYVVLDLRYDNEGIQEYLASGYEIVLEKEGIIMILKYAS